MRRVPLVPIRCGRLKSRVTRGDALQIDGLYGIPICDRHPLNLYFAHIRLDRYVMPALNCDTFGKANMSLRRKAMESKGKERGEEVQVLKAHLAINVRSVEQSIDFYRKLFGIEPSKVRTGYAKFDVQNPPLNFTLNQSAVANRGALSHLGMQVHSTSDVLAIRQQWQQAGLLTRDEMQTDCCYATQDKTWVRDPDGNEWEVFVVLKDNLAETAPCECGDKLSEPSLEVLSKATACDVPKPLAITNERTSNEAPCC